MSLEDKKCSWKNNHFQSETFQHHIVYTHSILVLSGIYRFHNRCNWKNPIQTDTHQDSKECSYPCSPFPSLSDMFPAHIIYMQTRQSSQFLFDTFQRSKAGSLPCYSCRSLTERFHCHKKCKQNLNWLHFVTNTYQPNMQGIQQCW